MKKLILISALGIISFQTFSQTPHSWSWGFHFSMIGNHSGFSGGDDDASALFQHHNFGSANFGIMVRKFYSEHWSLQSGITLGQLGFENTISHKNYSLLRKMDEQILVSRSEIGAAQFPLNVIYAFKPNCKNVRFYVGAGINFMTLFFDNQAGKYSSSGDWGV